MKATNYRSLVLMLALTLVCGMALGQRAKHRLADRRFKEYDFSASLAIYKDILEGNSSDTLALMRAGISSKHIGDFTASEQYFKALHGITKNAEALLLLADAQKLNQHYAEASFTYEQYLAIHPEALWLAGYTQDENWATVMLRDSASLDIRGAEINTAASEFAPCMAGNQVLFSSSRREGKGRSSTYAWNNQSYLNLFTATLTADSNITAARVMENKANSRYHEGSVAYDSFNQTLYFTRNQFLNGRKKADKSGVLRLAIYSAPYANGKLGKLVPFEHNDPAHSVGHPAVSPNGEVLIFSSDKPGGQGGTDLYFCTRKSRGWSVPQEMAQVNTPGDEMFPYLTPDSVLYFASSGWPGLGGLDVFRIDLREQGAVPENVGYPLNGPSDDFGLVWLEAQRRGFFTSNRAGGKGDDDIYCVHISNPDSVQVKGRILDAISGLPIQGASVYANVEDAYVLVGKTDANGEYDVNVPFSNGYDVQVQKDGYDLLDHRLEQSGSSAFLENEDWMLVPFSYSASGVVTGSADGDPVQGATVVLYNESGEEVETATTDATGKYSFELDPNRNWTIAVSASGYTDKIAAFDTHDLNNPKVNADVSLFKLEKGAVVRLENIYYDYNSSYIRDDAAVELDKVVVLMKRNPTLKIELSSHTDSRGSAKYNRWLSDRRAKNARDYIVSKGISGGRITNKGYGEDKPLNECVDGVECSEEAYQQNRRTEFKVLDI